MTVDDELRLRDEDSVLEEAEEQPRGKYPCKHSHLRGAQRCLGCGRTANEIALDDEG